MKEAPSFRAGSCHIEKPTISRVIKSITCDVCGKEYDVDDTFESQEFLHIDFGGGYGSIFGDGYQISADICQHCLKAKLGPYLKITRGEW